MQNVDLKDVLKLVTNDPGLKSFVTGSGCSHYYKVGGAYSGFVPTHSSKLRGLRIQTPRPNPFREQTFLEIELESAETVFLEVIDLMGRTVYSGEKNLPVGAYRWKIPG